MTTAVQRQRIDDAKRAGTRQRLIGERILPAWVDAWLAAWEGADHGDRFAPDYWERAHAWIAGEYSAGRRP